MRFPKQFMATQRHLFREIAELDNYLQMLHKSHRIPVLWAREWDTATTHICSILSLVQCSRAKDAIHFWQSEIGAHVPQCPMEAHGSPPKYPTRVTIRPL